MKIYVMLAALITILFCACSQLNEEQNVLSVGAQSIGVTGISLLKASFQIHGGTPTPCYKFYHADIQRDEMKVSIHVYAYSESERCVDLVWPVTWPIDLYVPTSGTYQFSFWCTDSTTVDTTLFIP